MTPPEAAVQNCILGFGPRPRLLYSWSGKERVAIGRKGEPLASLIAEIAACYPGALLLVADASPALAAYVAGWATAKVAAKGMRKGRFLAMSKDPAAIERSLVMDDDLMRRMWHRDPVLLPEDEEHPARIPVDSETSAYRHPWGIGKMVRTGEFTTRGKPRLRPVGRELSFRGLALRPYAHLPVRWSQEQLVAYPVRGDWGTAVKTCSSGNQKYRLQAHSVKSPVLELHGDAAMAHCKQHPAQTKIRNTNSHLVTALSDLALSSEPHHIVPSVSVRKLRHRRRHPTVANDWSWVRGPEFEFEPLLAKAA